MAKGAKNIILILGFTCLLLLAITIGMFAGGLRLADQILAQGQALHEAEQREVYYRAIIKNNGCENAKTNITLLHGAGRTAGKEK